MAVSFTNRELEWTNDKAKQKQKQSKGPELGQYGGMCKEMMGTKEKQKQIHKRKSRFCNSDPEQPSSSPQNS